MHECMNICMTVQYTLYASMYSMNVNDSYDRIFRAAVNVVGEMLDRDWLIYEGHCYTTFLLAKIYLFLFSSIQRSCGDRFGFQSNRMKMINKYFSSNSKQNKIQVF
jgi:hypothetical protein